MCRMKLQVMAEVTEFDHVRLQDGVVYILFMRVSISIFQWDS